MTTARVSQVSEAPVSGTHKVRARRTASPFAAALRRLGFSRPDSNVGQSLTLDAEWTVTVYRGETATWIRCERLREGWDDSVVFQAWSTTNRSRTQWVQETDMPFSHDLPLPSHIVGRWQTILAELGIK